MPLPNIDPDSLVPGTKVCISSASIKAGLLLLDPKSLKVPLSLDMNKPSTSRFKPHLRSTIVSLPDISAQIAFIPCRELDCQEGDHRDLSTDLQDLVPSNRICLPTGLDML